jgi:hypothetical protein
MENAKTSSKFHCCLAQCYYCYLAKSCDLGQWNWNVQLK